MAAGWRPAAEALVGDLEQIFPGRLRSVVAYGPRVDGVADAPLTCLALVDALGVSDLHECAQRAGGWRRRGLATPLILPEQEFHRSLDAFPLEYGEIIRTHDVVLGRDPFQGATIAREDLRRACETQIKGHLLHLREGYIDAAGRPDAVAELVAASAPAFAALLRNVARLSGAEPADRMEATRAGARAASLPEGLVRDILTLEAEDTVPTADAARLFPDYLTTVEQLAAAIDAWR